jgi:proteasome accessory factor C
VIAKKRVDPLERVLNLFTLLHRATSPMTREQIVQEMARGMTPYPTSEDAQRQLFASDKNTIVRDLGIPVRQVFAHGDDAGQVLYSITEEDMAVPEIDLTNDEMAVLSLALASIHHSVPEASEAMMKFEGFFPRRTGFDFHVDMPRLVVQLADAIQRRRYVEVHLDGNPVVIDPIRLLFDKGTWYVIAVEDGADSTMAFRCSRLGLDIVELDRPSTAVKRDFATEELRTLVHEARGEPIEATVLLDADGARLPWWDWRVRETAPVESGSGPAGGLRITVDIDDPARFRGWLIGFGPHATVESPVWLRNDIRAWIEAVRDGSSLAPSGADVDVEPPDQKGQRPGPRPIGERLQRLLSILPWLRLSGSVPVDHLADMLGVAPRQLMRDLEFASMCGVPPYTHDALFDFSVADEMVIVHSPPDELIVPGGRARRTKHLMTRPVRLTPRQATATAVALAGLEAVTGDLGIHNDAVETLRAKLADVAGDLPVQVRLESAPYLADVQKMVEESRRSRMTYVDVSGRITERLIDPLRVFIERGEAYVIADDASSGERAWTFRVDQIMDIEPTDVLFEPRDVAFTGWNFRGDVVDAVITIAPGNEWVLDRVHARAHRFEQDGSITMWLPVASDVWLARLLLRCGAPSTVVAPVELRPRIMAYADRLAQSYC